MEELDREDKVRVMFILLKQLQPFLSANNLTVVAPPRGSAGGGAYSSSLDRGQYSPKQGRTKAMRNPIQGNFLSNSQVV